MSISIFSLFAIGIGPSSSHTVGPMRASNAFISQLGESQLLSGISRIKVDLYGSLALTGKGHGTDRALLSGLEGNDPKDVDPKMIMSRMQQIIESKQLLFAGERFISFDCQKDLIFHSEELLPLHPNGLRFTAYGYDGSQLVSQVYYSIGGGFIVTEEEFGVEQETESFPYHFSDADELMQICKDNDLKVHEVMLTNELVLRSEAQIKNDLLELYKIMISSIEAGCHTTGVLPGGLNLRRRAPVLYEKLIKKDPHKHADIMNWVSTYAIAVNEENAAGNRIVTAPTNGAAGIVPAVLEYYKNFCDDFCEEGIIQFLLTAGAIAILYKKTASISGAEVGCQGEVGTASSMAAGALAAVLGGDIDQIENAAEIAMEHHLGMTCDPVLGLVQIPCIERNAMGAIKAVNAARLALLEDGEHKITLNQVIKTMYRTGKDMNSIYKETSKGGLAANIIEC